MRTLPILFLSLLLLGCQAKQQTEAAHSHADNGHSHAEARPTISKTIWTENVELFVEYPALVADLPSRFAAHFTLLNKHKPVTEGALTVSLIKSGKGIRQTVGSPASPGIFNPALKPQSTGAYQLIFELETAGLREKIIIADVQVFASAEAAAEAVEESAEGDITFLKEQAWKMEFATVPAKQAAVYDVISTYGQWQVAPTDLQTLVAPTAGMVIFQTNDITVGSKVSKGQQLAHITGQDLTSNNLQAELAQAQANFALAQDIFQRKETLYASKIIPKAEFEEALRDFEVAKARLTSLRQGYSQGGKVVRAPFDGYIKQVKVANGSFIQEGGAILQLSRPGENILEVQVSAAYANRLNAIQNIWFQTAEDRWANLNATGGTILSVGKEISADKPLIPVFAEVNAPVAMPDGSFTEVQLAVGQPETSTVVPVSALLEGYGNYSVIVQRSGESFERRPVSLGRRNGTEVAVTSGLEAGEMVVSKGAFQVKMASMSGQAPAHGHAH